MKETGSPSGDEGWVFLKPTPKHLGLSVSWDPGRSLGADEPYVVCISSTIQVGSSMVRARGHLTLTLTQTNPNPNPALYRGASRPSPSFISRTSGNGMPLLVPTQASRTTTGLTQGLLSSILRRAWARTGAGARGVGHSPALALTPPHPLQQ
jgi:hypothetical protein